MSKKLLILGNANNGSVLKITEAFKKHHWEVDAIEPRRFQLVIGKNPKGEGNIYLDYKPFSTIGYSAVIPRISGETFPYGIQVLRHIAAFSVKEREEWNTDNNVNEQLIIENWPTALDVCSDKFLTHQFLSFWDIESPITILTDNIVDYSFIGKTTKLPLVAKKRTSSQGKGVIRVKDIETANAFLSMVDRHMILQEFLDLRQEKDGQKERCASDIRAFTIGASSNFGYKPEVVAYTRYALRGDWKSNYTISKKGKPIELTEEQKELAIKVAKAVGAGICGVDLAVTKEGKTIVIEANGNPSLEGVTAITGINVADKICNFIMYEVGALESSNLRHDTLSNQKTLANSLDKSMFLNKSVHLEELIGIEKTSVETLVKHWKTLTTAPDNLYFQNCNQHGYGWLLLRKKNLTEAKKPNAARLFDIAIKMSQRQIISPDERAFSEAMIAKIASNF